MPTGGPSWAAEGDLGSVVSTTSVEGTLDSGERRRDSTESELEREDSSHLRSFSVYFLRTAAQKSMSDGKEEAMGVRGGRCRRSGRQHGRGRPPTPEWQAAREGEALTSNYYMKQPPNDQPALYPYLDWSTMQAYYGPGILPPTYFVPGISPGQTPPPYMWGPQPLLPSAFGKPYATIYPHGGGFSHPFMPLMVNPLSAEPAKSVNSKENNLNKKLKEIDGIAVSTGSGNSEKTSGDYSVEGSCHGDNHKASGTPKKRSLDDRPSSGAETGGASAPNDKPREPGRLATLPNLRIPDTAIKPNASTASDLRVTGTPLSTELPAKDDKESQRERRKQSNRESARRSRLRKQAETEELARKVELLTAENTSLRCEISRLTESSKKLRLENSALMEKLTDAVPDQAQEVSPDQTTAQSASVVENFLSMIDNTNTSRSSGHMEHGTPKLRQLLGSGLATDVAASRSVAAPIVLQHMHVAR